MAELATDPDERRRWLTVVIVGAGPTGVELAGQVRATRSLRNEFRSIDPSSVRVIVVDGGDEPLATFGDRLSHAARKELEALGVELQMHSRVVGVDADGGRAGRRRRRAPDRGAHHGVGGGWHARRRDCSPTRAARRSIVPDGSRWPTT